MQLKTEQLERQGRDGNCQYRSIPVEAVLLLLSCLTQKDKEDLAFIFAEKIEWIGLSFVRSANDIKVLKKIINRKKLQHKVIAKIEKPEAIKDIDKIIYSNKKSLQSIK